MHDPMTVAFDLRSPFSRNGYRPTLLTVWHVDPEHGGSDDSCGWSYVRAPQALRDQVRTLGEQEFVFISGRHGHELTPAALVMEVWQTIGGRVFNRSRWGGRGLTHRELVYVLNLANCPGDNLRSSCAAAITPEGMGRLFTAVLRCYLTFHRRWWQHPRWHLHHWRLQFHPIQKFKRWAFSRCAGCGGRFTYGYCPTSSAWGSDPPRWFRSERYAYHSECSNARVAR